MIQSMTGYGRATVDLPDKKVYVEVKSLNSKAMDLAVRVPTAYREKEMEIRNEVTRALVRGKVDFSLHADRKENASPDMPIDAVALMSYYQQIKQISALTGIPEPADYFGTLLRLPDTLKKEENAELSDEEWAAVHEAIEAAVGELVAFRTQEGAALEAKFRHNIAAIDSLLDSIAVYEAERVPKIRERIVEQLEKIVGVDYDHNRLEQELIFYIEKLDINEEKQRLANHLRYFIDTLEGPVGQGKKLGFIAQEMGREINTLGSKSNHAEMQKIVVQMKDELEQIKEQVLNVM